MSDRHAFRFDATEYGKAFLYAFVLHSGAAVLVVVLSQTSGSVNTRAGPVNAVLVEQESAPAAAHGKTAPAKPARPPASADTQYKGASSRRVLQHWKTPPVGIAEGLTCVLSLKVLADGTIADVRIVRGSGSSAFDESALQAVRNASPLAPPPRDALRGGIYEFELLFNPAA